MHISKVDLLLLLLQQRIAGKFFPESTFGNAKGKFTESRRTGYQRTAEGISYLRGWITTRTSASLARSNINRSRGAILAFWL